MTDIVKRLRREGDSCRDVCNALETANVMQEAADEIERLRMALRAARPFVDIYPVMVLVNDALGEADNGLDHP